MNDSISQETPLPPSSSSASATPHSTHKRRPSVSFNEISAKKLQANVLSHVKSAPSNLTQVSEGECTTADTGTTNTKTPHASVTNKRSRDSQPTSPAMTPTSSSPASPLRASAASKSSGPVTSSPVRHRRALSKTSLYHASSSPMALKPISPAMILSGAKLDNLDLGSTAASTATCGAELASATADPSKREEDHHSSAHDCDEEIHDPLSVRSCPALTHTHTGPGGRSLEIDTSPPTRIRKLTNLMTRLYDKYSPSLTLENKGSVARDHLEK
ncbi:hypothetical protein BGW41_008194 [Actinomortierella wolfii]|nr:hypothetical protein BGW41_008194 [Actinomortierella wolfii]